MANNEVIRPHEAAEVLMCSEYTVKSLVRRSILPHFRIGNRILFRRQTLIEWIDQQERLSITPKDK
jgi:excisionase family DNA binding protein